MRKREKTPVKKSRKPAKVRETKKQKPSPSKATAATKPRGRPRLDTPVPPAPPPAEKKPAKCKKAAVKEPRKSKKQNRSSLKATAAKKLRGRPRLDPPVPPPAEEKPSLLETLLLRLVSPLKSLPVQTSEAVVYIRPEDIAYVRTTEARRILIYDVNGQEWQRFDLLIDLEKRLKDDPRFFRPHKSFLVNIFAVKKLRKNPDTGLYELYFGDKVKGFAQAADGNMKELRQRLEL
jgi:DNA-binding LytR/AlgR family response regulator